MTETVITGSGVAVFLAAMAWFLRKSAKLNQESLDHLVSSVRELRKQNGRGTDPVSIPESITARLDGFELRLNEFKDYIDRKSRALGQERRRLQKLYPEVDDDEDFEPPPEEAVQAVRAMEEGQPTQPAEQSELSLSDIREMGARRYGG